jgi:N-acyl-D-aspartate/D-glutamate deacylase
MLDVALVGGQVVDGTGGPRRRRDVGISGGRIVAVAEPGSLGAARRTIELDGLVVAPGFVDVHTHFDAQVFWDGALTPSPLHGVTTALAGNCGFTLTPMAEAQADYLVRMLAVVEGMPLEALRAGVPLDWSSTGEYLDRIEGTLAVNAGFMVGHSALRRVVMGDAGTERAATSAEVEAMAALLRRGLGAGGLGFSSSWGVAHQDGDGAPVPSRHATPEELITLAGVCREFEGTSLEFLPPRIENWDGELTSLITGMSIAANRPLNWNVMRILASNVDECRAVLEAGGTASGRGGKVVALTMPIPSRSRFTFRTGFVLDALPDWGPVISLPPAERLAALRDPEVRRRLDIGARKAQGSLGEIAQWSNRVISETFSGDTKRYEGRLVADIAHEEGKTALDALLDIVCADDLGTVFSRPTTYLSSDDWAVNVELLREGRAMIGASDAGAHLDFTAYFDYPVYVLEHAVRGHGAMSLEEAVHLMTQVPARLYGLRDRGVLTEGAFADIAVFDEHTVASGELVTRFDLPAGAGRLYAEPAGVHHVLVNGTVLVEDGRLQDERPGRVVRSGRDTATPSVD